jgi:hypothetical protein
MDNEECKNNNQDKLLYNILLNLKVLGKIKTGHKLSIWEGNMCIDNTYVQSVNRWYNNNSRNTTVKFLENLDENITKKIEELLVLDDSSLFLDTKETLLLDLNHHLKTSIDGLRNLISTYQSDELIISNLELILNNFNLKIKKISNIIKVNN